MSQHERQRPPVAAPHPGDGPGRAHPDPGPVPPSPPTGPERSYHGPPPAERLRPLLDETTSPAPLAALPPFRPPPFEPIDADLDPDQRDAVARALASPDLYLIRGLPGSGKTRAVVELIRQAVRRGERVLFLAGTPQAIDAALRPLAGDAEVRLLRCLGRGERAESLPEPGRSCTWAAVRERLPAPAAAGAGAGELPAKLAALEARAGELDRELRRFAGERARSPAAPTPAAREARRAELRKRRADAAEALRRVGQEVAECERLQDSLRLRRWWTVAYWRAPRADDLAEKLSRLAGRRDTLEEELRALEQELAELEKGAGPEATAEEARLAAERGALAAEAEAVRARLRSLGTSGADPAAPGESPELYRDRANLFAGPVSAPVTDPVFAGASDGRPFDLLVLDDAESVSEAAFLPAARLARRWVLVGAESLGRPRGRPAAGRTRPGDCFDHLWRQLYGPAWVWEQGRLCCRLVRLTQRQRRHLAAEPVADRPEIELRIYAAPGGEPLLAEVVFPPGMPAREAKAYLFRELGVVTPQAARPVPRLEKRADGWFLSLTGREESGGGERVELAPGVREVLLDRPCPETGFAGTPWAAPVYTAGIEFAAGWDREQVEAWAREHTADIERRRATRLWNSHRQVPALAAWVRDLFGAEADGLATGAAAPVEFVPVPDAALPPGAPAPAAEGNGRPHPDSPFPSGAGLEIDLGNPGDRNRLPPDLAALLPRSGFVNLAEAERLVQILGRAFAPGGGDPEARGSPPSVGVVSLHPAQVELLRALLGREAWFASRAGHVRVAGPQELAQAEVDELYLSLTRSHRSRAVALGPDPALLELALTRARRRLVLVGDPGTLSRRARWQGRVDDLGEPEARHERACLRRLLAWLSGAGAAADPRRAPPAPDCRPASLPRGEGGGLHP